VRLLRCLQIFHFGAPSLNERDNICESVVRFVAAKGPTKQCFIGFENIVQGRTVLHDPTQELLKRLGDLRPRVLPLSRLKGMRVEHEMVVDYDDCHDKAVWWLWGIDRFSDGQAAVLALQGSTLYRFELVRKQGRWTTVRDEPMTYF